MVSLGPGESATTSLQITTPAGTTDGFYTVGAAVVNNSTPAFSASASVTTVIVSSLNVALSTNEASYASNRTVSMTAIVTIGGSPAPGAGVTFTINKPNGTVTTGTVVAGTNGSAVFSYRLNKKRDPDGTYQVEAVARLNGGLGIARTSFIVRQ